MLDFSKNGEKPVKSTVEFGLFYQPDIKKSQGQFVTLRRNIIQSSESWLHVVDELQSIFYEFYDLAPLKSWTFSAGDYGT